jgi:hypothetical protein
VFLVDLLQNERSSRVGGAHAFPGPIGGKLGGADPAMRSARFRDL